MDDDPRLFIDSQETFVLEQDIKAPLLRDVVTRLLRSSDIDHYRFAG
jgi:hypothetical protein